MNENVKGIFGNSASTSLDKCGRVARAKHIIEYSSYKPDADSHQSKPLLRACGCAHRFLPANRSSSTQCRRRSRSCTPDQTGPRKSDTPDCKLKSKNEQSGSSLTRHISENDLQQKRIIEIREVLEFTPQLCHHCSHDSQMESRVIRPYRYTTTIYVDMDSSDRRYVEEVSIQIRRMSPRRPDKQNWRQTHTSTIETTIKQTLSATNPINESVFVHKRETSEV